MVKIENGWQRNHHKPKKLGFFNYFEKVICVCTGTCSASLAQMT